MTSSNEKRQAEFESFFITIFDSKTSRKTTYLKLPSNNCFTYCVKEIIHALKNEIDNSKIADHAHVLINNFYNFMQNDTIMQKIDYLAFSRIILLLKNYTEVNTTSLSEKLAFFENLDARYSKKYRSAVFNSVKQLYEDNSTDENSYKIISLFINELLASGTNYLFLTYILKVYKQNKFISFQAFLEYIYYANQDSFDILIPIEGLRQKEEELFQLKDQKIERINGMTYCKVYGNKIIDFFYLIKENIVRIESLFNILRLYKNSTIDFLRSEKILVTSKYFNETFELTFDEINKYTGPNPYLKNLTMAVGNLDKLKEKDRISYHAILNTISYAEKDKDIMNASSFVDNWIALESLTSMCGRRNGYASVEYIVPKMLVAKIILNNATNTLENTYKNYKGHNINLEHFIKLACEDKYDFSKILNPYYRLELKKLGEIFSNPKKLQEEFERVEKIISLDLLRAYLLRNEYVHASNLRAFNSMQHIKIKHILPLSIDEFFKLLNNRIDKEIISTGVVFDVFTDVITKNELRSVSFKLLNDTVWLIKGRSKLTTSLEQHGISLDIYVFNVLKNNTDLFKKYLPSDNY